MANLNNNIAWLRPASRTGRQFVRRLVLVFRSGGIYDDTFTRHRATDLATPRMSRFW